MRDDEIGATHPLRSLLGDIARSPDAGAHDAPTAERRRHRGADRGPPGRPRLAASAHRGQPVLRRRDARPRRQRDPAHRPRCDARPHQRPRRRGLGLLHLLACAPEAIPDHLLGPLGIGLPALRAVDHAGLIRAGRAASRSATTCAAWRSAARSRPAVRCRSTAACSTPSSHRRTRTRPCSPTTRSAPVTPTRMLRHATDAGRAAARSGAHTQAAAFFRTALEQGAPDAGAGRGRAARAARRGVLPDRPARRRHRRQRAGDAAPRAEPGHAAASASTTTRSPCTTGTTPTASSRTGTPPPPSGARGDAAPACGRATSARSATPWRCRRTWPCRPTTSTARRSCSHEPRSPPRSRRPDPHGALAADRRHLRRAGGRAGQPRGDAGDPQHGPRALRRDLLERLQQPDLPRRRAAAAAAGRRAARLHPAAHDRAGPARSAGCGSSARVAG